MDPIWKIIKRLTIGLVALIVIAIVAAVIATDTEWFRDLVRDKANAVSALRRLRSSTPVIESKPRS